MTSLAKRFTSNHRTSRRPVSTFLLEFQLCTYYHVKKSSSFGQLSPFLETDPGGGGGGGGGFA